MAGGFQDVETTERGQDLLSDLAVLPMVFGNLQILIGAAGLHTEEHEQILSLRRPIFQIKTSLNTNYV